MIQSQKGILACAKDDENWKHYAKKISQTQKGKCCVIPLTWNTRISKSMETEHRVLPAQKFTENVLELYRSGGCTTQWMH